MLYFVQLEKNRNMIVGMFSNHFISEILSLKAIDCGKVKNMLFINQLFINEAYTV